MKNFLLQLDVVFKNSRYTCATVPKTNEEKNVSSSYLTKKIVPVYWEDTGNDPYDQISLANLKL